MRATRSIALFVTMVFFVTALTGCGISKNKYEALLNEKIALEEKKRERLGRFLSPQVASRLIATSDSQGFELGEPEIREVSVLFADIVGFTGMSETMNPSAVSLATPVPS